jgi:DNA polymerase elongation subunit (family B)
MIINIDEILGNTMIFDIDDQQAVDEFLEYIKEENILPPKSNEELWSDGNMYIISEEFKSQIFNPKKSGNYSNHLIFGKDETEELVSIEVKDDNIWLFFNDGRIETRPMIYWFLTNSQYSNTTKLKGNLYYQFIKEYNSLEKFQKDRGYMKFQKKADIYTVWDNNESAMVYNGLTLFKGLKVDDVSRLHFDIETNGLVKDQSSKVYIITNTFKHRDQIIKKVFSIDNYNNDDTLMIRDWVKWIQEINPTIINGHNILGFDFPYLSWCYGQRDGIDRDLELGRDCSEITYNKKPSKFRVDGSQDWTYHNINIFGRHIIDGAFLSVKYDFSRKYPSWKLKEIIEYELKLYKHDVSCLYKDKYGVYVTTHGGRLYKVKHTLEELEVEFY